jgi:hypothetical protein
MGGPATTPERKAQLREMARRATAASAAARAKRAGKPPIIESARSPIQTKGSEYKQWTDGRIEAYGSLWPVGCEAPQIEAALYAHDRIRNKTPGVRPKHHHFEKFIKLVLPESIFDWHRWVYEGCELWCDEEYWTCIGAAGTGKSAMFGAFVLCDWLAAPSETVTVLVSTSLDSLKARIYKFVIAYHGALIPQYRIGNFRMSNPLSLQFLDEPTDEVPQPQWQGAGVVCVGFKQGDSDQALKNHLGRHLPRNRMVVDELQGVNPGVLNIWWNSGASGEFRFGGLGNPQSMFDPLATASCPTGHTTTLGAFDWLHNTQMDHGKDENGHRRLKTWKTEFGRTLMFDGLDSPAVDDPKRFHYLINEKFIALARARGGENSNQWYAFVRGIFPPSGSGNTLLNAREIKETRSEEKDVVWDGPTLDWLWGDLAHSGEDDAVIQHARVGVVEGGSHMIQLLERKILQVDLKKGFVSQQMAAQVCAFARQHSIPAGRMAIDATATQGAMIDVIEQKLGSQGIVRVHASGPASKRMPVKLGWPQMCDEAYANRAAELAGNFREFVRCGQVRGVDPILAQQACSRVTLPQEESGGVLELDPDKKAANNGKSPNELDVVCIGATALRERGGIHPGDGKVAMAQDQSMEAWRERAAAVDVRARGNRIGRLLQRY